MSWLTRAHVALLRAFSRRPARARTNATRPETVPIAAVEDGARVRVGARVAARTDPLRAPLTGRPCTFWEITIEELVKEHLRAPRWVGRLRDSGAVGFDVEDDSGRASIEVEGMRAWARADATREEPAPVALDPALQRLLVRYDNPVAPLRQRRGKLRVREGIFEPGEIVIIQGRAQWVDDAPAEVVGFRDGARRRRLVIGPDEDEPVYASDDENGPY